MGVGGGRGQVGNDTRRERGWKLDRKRVHAIASKTRANFKNRREDGNLRECVAVIIVW